MDGTIQQPSTDTIYDWTACNSTGPFTLMPQDTLVIAFAVLGGDNLSDLQANADTAYNRYWQVIGAEETSNLSISSLSIYPAISSGSPYSLSYNLIRKQPLRLKIYNTLGQLVKERNYGLCHGAGEVSFDLKSFAQGVYFVKVEAGNTTNTTKIIWLR
jgi:hypothetical protein